MSVLALISDLLMQSQVSAAAERAGTTLQAISTVDALVARAAEEPPRLLIVDLSHPGLDPAALMTRLKPLLAADARTLAFGPHVQKPRLEAAAAAGFDTVLSRGEFHARLGTILAGEA